MSGTSTVVLEVAADRAPDLISALSKRDYIKVVTLDREEKKRRKVCPCCGSKFPREVTYTVTSELLEALFCVVRKMKVSKSVVLVNKENPINRLPDYERPRCVEMASRLIQRAELLGLLKPFQDGSRLTHFVSEDGLAFLLNKEPLTPSSVVLSHGQVVERTGSVMVEDVKFKDRVQHDKLLREMKKAISELPKAVIEFVEKGQISLI